MTAGSRRKPKSPPPTHGNPTTRSERDFRLRIVERCIVTGITSVEAICAALKRNGRDIPERTVGDYIRLARKTLKKEDESLRDLRRQVLVRDVHDINQMMLDRLTGSKKVPAWQDLVSLMRLRLEVETSGYIEDAPPPQQHEDSDLEGKTEKEIDEMIVKMFNEINFPDEVVRKIKERA